jgi:hypothetical protein
VPVQPLIETISKLLCLVLRMRDIVELMKLNLFFIQYFSGCKRVIISRFKGTVKIENFDTLMK